MLELNAHAFLGAATNLARLHQIFSNIPLERHGDALVEASVIAVRNQVLLFNEEAAKLGARLASVSADRLLLALEPEPCRVTVHQAILALNDIESRFADYLHEVQLFVLYPQDTVMLQPADDLIESPGFSACFPNASFEVEEAAKSIALGRSTASVFHSMRMLEIGIKALARRLDIPDPTKASEKNWSHVLTSIKEKIDETWPRSRRLPGSLGAKLEDLHAHLDAVRNPWRNATMHVENIYQPHEALHILRCAAFFMRKLSEVSTESGEDPDIAGLLGG